MHIIPHTHQPRITLLLTRKPLVVRGRSISKLMSRLPPVLLFDDGPAVPGALFQLAGLLLPPIVAVRALASGDGGKRTTSRLKAPLKSNSKRRLFIRLPLSRFPSLPARTLLYVSSNNCGYRFVIRCIASYVK